MQKDWGVIFESSGADDEQKKREENSTNCKGGKNETKKEEGEEQGQEEEEEGKRKKITLEVVDLGKENTKYAVVLRNVLSKSECDQIIAASDKQGYTPLLDYPKHYRANTRLQVRDRHTAALIWARIRRAKLLPAFLDHGGARWDASGLNEQFRLCKYGTGDHFSPHEDACFRRSASERSFFTFMIYLNGGLQNGHTRFLRARWRSKEHESKAEPPSNVLCSVEPEPGLVLCFQHDILHDGQALGAKSRNKYIMRSDVMFTKHPATKPAGPPAGAS